MHVILSLNGFNITYKSKQRAQARLDRSAPCLGLSIFRILNVQYRVAIEEIVWKDFREKYRDLKIESN